MVRFTGWLAHLDHTTTDGRTLTTPLHGTDGAPNGLVPVLNPAPSRQWVGEVREVWIEDDWLRGNGEINLGALPVGYRVPKIGAEVDVDGGVMSTVYHQDRNEYGLIVRGWTLRAVTIGDRPAWPDARLELEL
jgi:hypothetical protein